MRNFKLTLKYDGTDFFGWQVQPQGRTVQETLELAIGKITCVRPFANASGRTDSGVHALGQVVNFHSETTLPAAKLMRAINANLPEDLVIVEGIEVDPAFDANRHALRKMYRYVIRDNPIADPFTRRYAYHVKQVLDQEAMARAARVLVGTHDFHSFETEWPNRKTSVRTIYSLGVTRTSESIGIEVEADGFLYNMVRAIAGTLINVGRGYWPEEKVAEILHAEDRRLAGPTAPACGLFLVRVTY